MQKLILSTLTHISLKIVDTFSHLAGWWIAAMAFAATYCGHQLVLIHYVLVCILVDMLWGIAAYIKIHKFVLSQAIAKTAIKIAAYITIFTLVTMGEHVLNDSWFIASRVTCATLCAAELWSSMGHILVVQPRMPVVKLLRKYLAGEISRKLGIGVEEVNDLLTSNTDAK